MYLTFKDSGLSLEGLLGSNSDRECLKKVLQDSGLTTLLVG